MEIVDDAVEADTGTRPRRTSGIGSTIVRSKDGDLWYSASKNVQGTGATLPYLIRLDPKTLEREIIRIEGNGIYPPPNSWYAWTPDPFCASSVTNTLYWCGGPNSWFTNSQVFKFDIETRSVTNIINFNELPGDWHVYGCSLGIHPVTDELYAAVFHKFVDPTYETWRFNADGTLIKSYPMISNYWFPSLPVFPQQHNESGIDDIEADAGVRTGDLYTTGGVLVRSNVSLDQLDRLTPGLYIWTCASDRRKIIIR
ncbi:MAG: DUF5074 domain-containing protein, partial [Muribaculaceae bacterium]|nr:DUF5074 domain-containing protein [Muribaculaceae bacterium]